MKYVRRRTLYVILAVVVLFVAFVFTVSNGSMLALNMAYLRCTTLETGGDFASTKDERAFRFERPTTFGQIKMGGDFASTKGERAFRPERPIFGRLKKDWVNNRVLLNWVADVGEKEDGLESTLSLSIHVDQYSSYGIFDKVQRNLDRATLIYTWKKRDSVSLDVIAWTTRQCELIDKTTFEAQRKKVADATITQRKI